MLQLNNCQANAVSQILSAFQNKEKRFFLSGRPGTGKTYTTGEIVRAFHNLGMSIAVCASDNTAVIRAKDHAREYGWYRYVKFFGTVHRLFGLLYDPIEDMTTQAGQSIAGTFNVVIVDESSKLHAPLVDRLVKECKFVLFVGDRNQLLPVGDSAVTAFQSRGVELLEVMRQSDQQLMIAIESALDAVRGEKGFDVGTVSEYAEFDLLKWQRQLTGAADQMALCYTNMEADRINRVVRKQMGRVEEYEAGDRIIFTAPFYGRDYNGRRKLKFSTSVIATVVSASRYKAGPYPMWSLRVKTSETEDYISVFDTSGDNLHWIQYHIECERIERDKAIAEHRKPAKSMVPQTAEIKYAYAITTHRAEGNEWDNVFVQMRDFSRCFDDDTRNRLLYVALSRTKKNLCILMHTYHQKKMEAR